MHTSGLVSCHTINMIEFEPEYHVNFGNPDIDEKPPNVIGGDASECEALHSCFQNQEGFVIHLMARAPHMKLLIDMYREPDVVTAKQQEEELQRGSSTFPESIPSSVKWFTDKNSTIS
ncbi:hypothetical protein BDA96_10G284700 [Sorghum bicolor]|uniref:Uncharacterized protein n=2 Tax=Sorghum bicolor TaxID=4558 RepID=A0A921Q527_SORBI|nr:hypothetical protein SORBI_3010G219900 [Sorghum bicolor]KAG0515508.1 hypothetical protein BDA96_10G284700 [Sorghum bicolor]